MENKYRNGLQRFYERFPNWARPEIPIERTDERDYLGIGAADMGVVKMINEAVVDSQ